MDIHTALQVHSEHHIQCFLKSHKDIDVKDICDQTPLHIASAQGMLDVVKSLLKKKANVNAKDSKGWTPLHCAANEQQYDICLALIQHKADLSITTQDQASVLAYSSKGQRDSGKQVQVLKTIYSKSPELLDQSNSRKETPLLRACMSGSVEAIQFLLSQNANLNAQTIEGVSCLHNAVRSGRKNVVKLLIESKADATLKNKENFTAQQEAAEFGDKEMADYIKSLLAPATFHNPAKRHSVVAELVNVFNRNETIKDQPKRAPIQANAEAVQPKQILPPSPEEKPLSQASNPDNNSSVQLKPKSRTSKRLSLRSKKRNDPDKIEHSEKPEKPEKSEKSEKSDEQDSEIGMYGFHADTERLLELLADVDILSLPNGTEIDEQITKVKLHLLGNKKTTTRSRAETFTKTIIGKFSPARGSVINPEKTNGNVLAVPKRPPRKGTSLESSDLQEIPSKGENLPLLTAGDESQPSSTKNTPKTKSRRGNRHQIAQTIGTIGKFIDETAAIAVAPLTSSVGAEEAPLKKTLDIDEYFQKENTYIDQLNLPETRVMDASQKGNLRKDVRARILTLEEIMATETQYVRQIGTVVAFYIRPLQNELQELISSTDLKTIFCNLEEIFDLSIRLLQALTEEEKKLPAEQQIGAVFNSFANDFKAYTPYCTSQITAMETLERLMQQNKMFEQFVCKTKDKEDLMKEDLNGYLIKPFQRICRYVLLLKELMKQTPANWSDCDGIKDAIGAVDAVVRRANETQRVMDNLTKIEQIQAKLDIQLDLKRAVKFITEGDVKEIDHGHAQKRHFFLFNSLLVVVKPGRSGKWINKYTVPVERCIVWNVNDTDHQKYCFQIVRTDCTDKIIFSCKSENEKENFMNAINEAISPNGLFSVSLFLCLFYMY